MKTSIISRLSTLFLISGILTACHNEHKSLTVKAEIDTKSHIADSVLFQNPEMVFLETNEESFIRMVSSVACTDSTIYIFDSMQNHVFLFNRQGRFIKRIGTIGQGPKEYTDLYTMACNPANNEVIVATAPPLRLQFYSAEGNFIAETPIPDHIEDMICTPRGITVKAALNDDYELAEYKIENHRFVKASPIEIPRMEVKNFFRPEGNYFSFHADTLLYTRRFDNRIYRIENGKAMTFMEIDFGKFFNAENRLLSNTEMQRQDPKGNVLSINNIKHSNGKLMFNIFPHGIMTCTTEGVAPAQYDHFTNSNFSIMHSQMNASWDTTGNSLVYSVDNLNLRSFLDLRESLNKPVNPDLAEKVKQMNPTDNPVLFIYRMK